MSKRRADEAESLKSDEILPLNKIQKSEIESSSLPLSENNPIVGTSDFDEIISENAFVVDKTLFIKEFMNDPSKVICILRPR